MLIIYRRTLDQIDQNMHYIMSSSSKYTEIDYSVLLFYFPKHKTPRIYYLEDWGKHNLRRHTLRLKLC